MHELEAEIAELRRKLAEPHVDHAKQPGTERHRVRGTVSGLLIALLIPITATALVAVWLSTTVLDNDRYVTTVTPLAEDSDIQASVAQRVTDQLFQQVDVAAAVRNALPPDSQGLAAPITSQIRSFVEGQVVAVMQTDAFTNIWETANSITHKQITDLLLDRGDNRALVENDGVVSVDLHALLVQVLDRLAQNGVTLFQSVPADKVQGNFVLFQSDDLAKASDAAQTLDVVRWAAPVTLLVLIGAILAVSTNRRRATAWMGLALLCAMVIVAIALSIGRNTAVDAMENVGMTKDAATSAYDTLTRFLQRSYVVGLMLGVVIVCAATLTGQGRAANAAKSVVHSWSTKLAYWLREQGWTPNAVSEWIDVHRSSVRTGLIVLAAITFVAWTNPTALVVVMIVGVTLLLLFAVEVIFQARVVVVDVSNGKPDDSFAH